MGLDTLGNTICMGNRIHIPLEVTLLHHPVGFPGIVVAEQDLACHQCICAAAKLVVIGISDAVVALVPLLQLVGNQTRDAAQLRNILLRLGPCAAGKVKLMGVHVVAVHLVRRVHHGAHQLGLQLMGIIGCSDDIDAGILVVGYLLGKVDELVDGPVILGHIQILLFHQIQVDHDAVELHTERQGVQVAVVGVVIDTSLQGICLVGVCSIEVIQRVSKTLAQNVSEVFHANGHIRQLVARGKGAQLRRHIRCFFGADDQLYLNVGMTLLEHFHSLSDVVFKIRRNKDGYLDRIRRLPCILGFCGTAVVTVAAAAGKQTGEHDDGKCQRQHSRDVFLHSFVPPLSGFWLLSLIVLCYFNYTTCIFFRKLEITHKMLEIKLNPSLAGKSWKPA